jgi:hypothetical protein
VNHLDEEGFDMGKRFLILLIVVSMALFGSLAFAGDDWQDGFAKALDENNLAGALMLAYNNHASPRAVYDALDAFGVGQEEVEQSIMLADVPEYCASWCALYQSCCCDQSPCADPDACDAAEGPPCYCTCDGSG